MGFGGGLGGWVVFWGFFGCCVVILDFRVLGGVGVIWVFHGWWLGLVV